MPAHSLYLLLMTSVYLILFIPFWKPLISSKLFYTNSISLYNTSSHTTSKPRYIFPSGIPTCILICREIFQFCDLVMLLIIFLCAVSSFMCSYLPFQNFSCCHCFSLLFSNICSSFSSSLHRCLFNPSLLVHHNFWIPDRNHAYQTLLFTPQWS